MYSNGVAWQMAHEINIDDDQWQYVAIQWPMTWQYDIDIIDDD